MDGVSLLAHVRCEAFLPVTWLGDKWRTEDIEQVRRQSD
jgi:hypothetical protein